MDNSIVPFPHNSPMFNFNGFDIRTHIKDDETWFCAADVCAAVSISDTKQAVSRLDDDERGGYPILTGGGIQIMTCVNEPGLYALLGNSRKEAAKVFKRWINHEVLPAIRKTGTYSLSTNPPSSLDIAENMIKTLRAHEDWMKRTDARLDTSEEKQAYFTIFGYANYIGRHLDNSTASQLGKQCTKLSLHENIHIGSAKDPKYGQIKTYHESILKRVFDVWYSQPPLIVDGL